MQEEVESKTIALIIDTTKLTGHVLKDAISQYLAHRRDAARGGVVHHGKQTVKQLVQQNQGVANIEVTDKNIKDFERVARKYGVDYALRKDRSSQPPKYLVFFKAKDGDALTAAFKEYSADTERKNERPSVLQQLRKLRDMAASLVPNQERRKEHDAR